MCNFKTGAISLSLSDMLKLCRPSSHSSFFFSSLSLFSSIGPSVWNILSFCVRHAQTLSSFRSQLFLSFFFFPPLVPRSGTFSLSVCDMLRLCHPSGHSSFSLSIFSSIGPSVWNILPFCVRHAQTLSSFKSQLKTHFLCFLLQTLPTVSSLCACVCVCVCACARACACVRACVRVCVCVRARMHVCVCIEGLGRWGRKTRPNIQLFENKVSLSGFQPRFLCFLPERLMILLGQTGSQTVLL